MSTSLIDRLEARSKRRMSAGAASRAELRVSRLTGLSSAFFARFGLEDPWATQDEPTREDDGLHFLSGRRYYARMRRLALSRWWRERRQTDFESRRPGLKTAARKRFPGEPRRAFSWGIALNESSMVLPPPVVQAASEDPVDEAAPRKSGWGEKFGASVSSSPWLVTPWRGSRVARRAEEPEVLYIERDAEGDRPVARAQRPERQARLGIARAERPSERLGRLLESTVNARDPVVQAVQAAAPLLDQRGRRELARVLERTVTFDVRTRVIEVQKIIRKVATSRVIRTVVDEVAPAQTPSRRARTRGLQSGLRPVMSGSATFSDAVAALAPDRPVAAAALRGQPSSSTRLSAGPVRRRAPIASGSSVQATRGARVVRTATGAYVAARSERTPSTDFTGAITASHSPSDWQGARSGVTAGRAWAGARSLTTAAQDWFGASVASSSSRAWAGALSTRTASGEWTGASSTTTEGSPYRRSALRRTPKGAFTGARTASTPASEWTSARLGSANWAAERLASTGRPGRTKGGRQSLLPRMAPRAPEGTLVVHAETLEEAQQIATRVRHMGATARIVDSPWFQTPWKGAAVAGKRERSAPAVAAAERATAMPAVAATVSRVVTRRMPGAPQTRGPLVHARTSPVSTATVIRHVDPSEYEGARSGSTPRGSWSGAGSFTTSAGDWTGASTADGRVSGWSGATVSSTAASAWAGARSGTTPGGDFTGAVVSSTPASTWAGARSGTTEGGDFTGARSGVTSRGSWKGARSGRTNSGAWGGAGTFLTPDGQWSGARTGSSRPMDWLGARVAFGQGSSAYRGAFSGTTGSSDWTGAGVFGTPRGAWNGARRTRTPLGWHSSPDMGLPPREMTSTLAAMAHGSPMPGIPGWAERTDRPHRLRASGELLQQLADARDPAAVVEIIVQRGAELRNTRLPKPVIQVIEQIQTVAAGGGGAKQSLQDRVRDARSDLNGAPQRGGFRRGTRSSARVINGWTGLRPGASASTSQSAVGADKVMKLAQKLKSLIHLAKGGNVAEAQRHAKLAHADRPDKSIEKGGDVGSSETAARQSVDIEALGREVLEVVNRELEMRQERRQEDSDVNIWW